jgi:hypothetical protein
MDFDVKNIFFEAVEYSDYVRSFFFIKKQKESGWHKGVFLAGLHEIYFHYVNYLEIKFGAENGRNPNLKIEDISISIEKETDGKQNGKLTKAILDKLEIAILSAYEIDKQQEKFDDVEIITFVEYGLWFIRNEFQIQIGVKSDEWFRPRTQTYFIYLIISEAPFLDFPKFKNAVRNLLWKNQSNLALKKTLENYYKASFEIVEIWNKTLFKLEQKSNIEKEKGLPETVKMEFKHKTLSHAWWNDVPLFDAKEHKRYLNQDFAQFAAKIANLLAPEVTSIKNEELKALQKHFVKDFLDGIHELQNDGAIQHFIKTIKEKKEKTEAPFANWFKNWFKAKKYFTEVEPPKGNGRIDLRVSHTAVGNRIIEFKGWWNSKKYDIVSQVVGYLTEFEDEGYIFLIDDTKTGILKKYKNIITSSETSYQNDSWETENYFPNSYKFYKSMHKINGDTKTLFHFIFSIQNV